MCDFISKNKNLFNKLDIFIDSINYNEEKIMDTLHYAQNLFGYLPIDVQTYIAQKLNMTFKEVNNIINFYSYFITELKGKYQIKICLGSACSKNNNHGIIAEFERLLNIKVGETTKDRKFTLDSGGCVGMCRKTPVVTINGRVYDNVTIEDVPLILKNYD